MLKKKEGEWEQQYAKLKKEFDSLLEKNQNDLVKIRIREKTLNDKIAAIQLERQQEVRRLKEQIAILQDKQNIWSKQQPKMKNTQREEMISYQKLLKAKDQQIKQLMQKNNHLSSNIISLQRQVIDIRTVLKEKESKQAYQIVSGQKCVEEKTIDKLQKDNQKQRILITRLQQQAKQHQINYARLRAEKDEKILLSQSARMKETEQLKEKIDQLKQDIKRLQSQWQQANNQARKMMIIRQMKEKQIQALQKMVEQVKNKPIEIVKCLKCNDIEQQLQLQKEMLKSVRMMLKFKEMELENLSK